MRRVLLPIGLSLLAFARPAAAEWHISPMVGLTFRAFTNAAAVGQAPIGTHRNFGGAVALLGGGILGVEGVGVFTPTFKGDDPLVTALVPSSRALAVMGNVVITTPRRWTEYSLRPYVSGGLGVMRLSVVTAKSVLPTRSTAAGFDVGGGAVGFLSKHTGLRFDLRYYPRLARGHPQPQDTDEPQFSFMTVSVGGVFRRGPADALSPRPPPD